MALTLLLRHKHITGTLLTPPANWKLQPGEGWEGRGGSNGWGWGVEGRIGSAWAASLSEVYSLWPPSFELNRLHHLVFSHTQSRRLADSLRSCSAKSRQLCVFARTTVAGWNPLCSTCHAAAQSPPPPQQAGHKNWLSCCSEKEKEIEVEGCAWGWGVGKGWCLSTAFISFLMLAWNSVLISIWLWSLLATLPTNHPPTPDYVRLPPPRASLRSMLAIWKRLRGLPTQLSIRPSRPTLPPFQTLLSNLSHLWLGKWQRLQISGDTLLPFLMWCSSKSLWRMKVVLWPPPGTCLHMVLAIFTGHLCWSHWVVCHFLKTNTKDIFFLYEASPEKKKVEQNCSVKFFYLLLYITEFKKKKMKIRHAAVDCVAALRRLIKDLLFVLSQKINTGTSFLTLERLFNQHFLCRKQVVTEVSLASNEEEMLFTEL